MIDPKTYTTRGLFCGAREIATRGFFTCIDVVVITKKAKKGGSGIPLQQVQPAELAKYDPLLVIEDEEVLLIIKIFLHVNK